ncbi:hypothetical protein CPC08DRAFT_339968 [Agrocybe pediades]|nr:hypothetical protein CPC08DRAFT_339968 [Agrocybe pediades]
MFQHHKSTPLLVQHSFQSSTATMNPNAPDDDGKAAAASALLLSALMFRKFNTLAALAFLIYECVVTFREECRHIWRRPFNHVQRTYVFSRYFALIVQSINVFLVLGPISAPAIPELTCKKWFAFQMVAVCSLLGALDYILMLRLYALHLKSIKVGATLVSLYLFQIFVTVVCAPIYVLYVPYDSICVSQKVQRCFIAYGATVWFVHIVMGILTAVKWKSLLHAPLARLVNRDSVWALALICGIFGILVPYNLSLQMEKPELGFMWPSCFLSIGCCRIIMNMQTANIEAPSPNNTINANANANALEQIEIALQALTENNTLNEGGLGLGATTTRTSEGQAQAQA